MGKWSGKGQPPTRRKLHKFRRDREMERIAIERERKINQRAWDEQWEEMMKGVRDGQEYCRSSA